MRDYDFTVRHVIEKWRSDKKAEREKEERQMKNLKRFTLVLLLTILFLIIEAVGRW